MTDMLSSGMAWLDAKRSAHLSTSVVCRRSGEDDTAVMATLGRTWYDTEDGFGHTTQAFATDFVIGAAAWPHGDEPVPGDRMIVGGVVYEVLALEGQGAWRYCDAHRVMIRIHTKEVA